MANHYGDPDRKVISADDARGGVTGHNVRYVLGYGLAGIISAFAGLAIYLGFDRLREKVAAAFASSPSEVLRECAPYAGILVAAALIAGLLLSLWSLISGRSDDGSQNLMRLRVAGQFAVIGAIMAIFYVSSA